MADPIKWKSKIILVKPETIYGADPTPTGPANAMLLTDVELQPMEGEDVSRNLEQPFMGAQEDIPTGIYVTLTGSFELVGSGSLGVAPAWSPLLRACGVAEVVTANTKVEYSPVSDGHESFGTYFHIGPSRHVILGGRATGKLILNAQGIPVVRVTITGLFTTPADAGRPTVDLSAFQTPQVASKATTPAFTIGGAPFVLRSFELDFGNDVQQRLLVGVERIVIVDKSEAIAATVEAVPLATYNPFQVAQTAGARQAIVLNHGTGVGRRVRVEAAQAQQKRLTGYSNAQNVLEWPLGFKPLPTSAGNDQWKITLT